MTFLCSLFFTGACNLPPPPVHRYPSWDLCLVLQVLTDSSFELLSSASLTFLTFKVAFLVMVTSARRVSELVALSIHRDLCIFHSYCVILRMDPNFLPKINTWFHRAQEVVFPDFCSSPVHPREQRWYSLDVCWVLKKVYC